MKNSRTDKLVGQLLSYCEQEIDFWPNSRHFFDAGEASLAFGGIYIYLLSRDDLWSKHHALIARIKSNLREEVDVEALELSVMDGGRYCETKARVEWRQAVVKEFSGSSP